MSNEESLKWLERRQLPTPEFATAEDLFAAIPFREVTALQYTIPTESGRKVALARGLFWQLKPESNVLVWLRNWIVWPSRAHIPLVLRLRQALGCEQSLEEAPGHLFEASEVDDAISLLILSLEFSWDCFLFDANRRFMCFVSHDEYLVLMGTDQSLVNRIGGVFESAEWCRRMAS